MTPTHRLHALGLVAFLLLAPALSASIAELATFDEKVENAAAILMGTCVRTEARWDAAHRSILTYSTFRVDKVIKGSPILGEVTIVTPGGALDGLHQETIGIPTFRSGDERVLFVRMTKAGPTVLYFDQGTYDVHTERGQKIITPASSKLMKVDATGRAVTEGEPPRELDSFEHAVQDSARAIADRHQKMDALSPRRQHQQEASIWSILRRNSLLVGLALAGLGIATWQLMRR
jgi:hypothetical protein